jgi:hypothetical protein
MTHEKFLESFADVITNEFNGDLNKAYAFCIGGRMIISDPLHQKGLRAFSESVEWLSKQRENKIPTDPHQTTQSFEERARVFYEKSKGGK